MPSYSETYAARFNLPLEGGLPGALEELPSPSINSQFAVACCGIVRRVLKVMLDLGAQIGYDGFAAVWAVVFSAVRRFFN